MIAPGSENVVGSPVSLNVENGDSYTPGAVTLEMNPCAVPPDLFHTDMNRRWLPVAALTETKKRVGVAAGQMLGVAQEVVYQRRAIYEDLAIRNAAAFNPATWQSQ